MCKGTASAWTVIRGTSRASRILTNADMGPAEVREHCPLDDAGRALLRAAVQRLGMSARALHRILELARTIADLEGAAEIKAHYLAEALQYRPSDSDECAVH